MTDIDTNSPEFMAGIAAYDSEPFVKGFGRATDFHGSKVAKLRAFLETYEAAKPSESDLVDSLKDALRTALMEVALETVNHAETLKGITVKAMNAISLPATPDEAKARLRIIADAVAANPSVLHMSSWHHPCGTAHCLAGSAIDNEGAEGYDLEERFGPQAAGAILLGIDTIKMFTVSDARAAEWLKQFETPKALEGVE